MLSIRTVNQHTTSTCALKIQKLTIHFSFNSIKMQMKMDKKSMQKFDKQKIRRILETENDFITNLFKTFEVPDSIEGKLRP